LMVLTWWLAYRDTPGGGAYPQHPEK